MLPGVELARRRRVHYHGEVVGVGPGIGEHHHAHQHKLGPATSHAATGMVGPALAARNRLQERLSGAASPSSSRLVQSTAVSYSDNNIRKTEEKIAKKLL